MIVKVFGFLAVVIFTVIVHTATVVFEPEIARDIALEQFESSDVAVQKMRAYESGKGYTFMLVDLAIPLAAVCLWGGDVARFSKRFIRKVISEGGVS